MDRLEIPNTRDKIFKDEFYFFLDKFKKQEPFALLRFSDGEMYMLQDKKIILSPNQIMVEGVTNGTGGHPEHDKKTYDPVTQKDFRDALWDSFTHRQENYYVGISCRCCVGQGNFDWQIEALGGDHDNLTWSNVLLNANYPLFMEDFYPEIQKRGAYVICNEKADLSGLDWVKGDFRIGTDAFSDMTPIESVENFIESQNIEGEVFLFSASAFSNVAQHKLFSKYPKNTYIDIGTTLSYEYKIPSRRGYLTEYHAQNKRYKTCIW